MSFNAFKARYSIAIPDPEMPGPRYHTVIFVATNSDGSGFIHHVTGDLVTGMRYERKIALKFSRLMPRCYALQAAFSSRSIIDSPPHYISFLLRIKSPGAGHSHVEVRKKTSQIALRAKRSKCSKLA